MHQQYDFKQFTLDDLSLLMALHQEVYGWSPSLKELRTKYTTESLGGDVIGFFAVDPATRDAVAYYGVFPVGVQVAGARVLAAQSGDTMTHPKHQGRGLFTTLAKMAYERARESGIAIVFGFPNANSFPGFVRKLGWSHCYDMISFTFWAPTLPVSEIWRVSSPIAALHRRLACRILRRFASGQLPDSLGSIIESGREGIIRDDKFYSYKSDDLFAFRVKGAIAWVRLGKAFEIGDIAGLNSANLASVMRRLKLIAGLLGYIRLRFYCSPSCELASILSMCYSFRKSLPYGAVSLDGITSGSNLMFTYIDYDTF